MNQISDYIDTNIPVIATMEQKYGSMLQRLTNEQKIFLIFSVSQELEENYLKVHPDEMYELSHRLSREITEEGDAIGLLKALVNAL